MNNNKTRNTGKPKRSSKRRGFSNAASGGRGKRRPISNIDPNTLIKAVSGSDEHIEEEYSPVHGFDQMPIDARLKSNLAKMGYKHPTQIQAETVSHLTEGRDLVGVANTGTGKTSAFLIPIIEQMLQSTSTKALVVVPTRELALQVEKEFKDLSKDMHLFAASFIGGTNIGQDLKKLRKHQHMIIGTPGRLMDLSNRRALNFQDVSVLVLDEFDRMLDMGFVTDINKIVRLMTNRKQTMLFSATIDNTQKSLIAKLLNNPVEVKVRATKPQIEQDIIHVPRNGNKFEMLLGLIGDEEFEKVLLFAETKRLVNKVSKQLNQAGINADQIHGNKSQNYRIKALNKFKQGNIQVLVATDVAARGIDVSNITHVINYQLPLTLDDYTHRIGRTGRAGKKGKAFTFVDQAL